MAKTKLEELNAAILQRQVEIDAYYAEHKRKTLDLVKLRDKLALLDQIKDVTGVDAEQLKQILNAESIKDESIVSELNTGRKRP